jgi:hypothetical protein
MRLYLGDVISDQKEKLNGKQGDTHPRFQAKKGPLLLATLLVFCNSELVFHYSKSFF